MEKFVASGQSHRAPCQFFDFTQDNPPNRILKRTTRLLAGAAALVALPAAQIELRRRGERILSYLATVSDERVSGADFNRLRLRGSLSHYAPIIRKCRAVLEGAYLSSEPGPHAQDAFLWSMPLLFQGALHGLLETTPGVNLDAARAVRTLRDPGGEVLQRRRVNPDFVFTKAGTRWVLDAKYKDTRLLANGDEAMELEVAPGRRIRINAADIYQVTAYGQHEKYAPARLGLVYPVVLAPGQKFPAPHRITGFAQDVYILFLDLGASARANIAAFGQSIDALPAPVAHAA